MCQKNKPKPKPKPKPTVYDNILFDLDFLFIHPRSARDKFVSLSDKGNPLNRLPRMEYSGKSTKHACKVQV